MIEPYYSQDGITIYNVDSREVLPEITEIGCLIFDPPWHDETANDIEMPTAVSLLVFTDARRLGQAVERFGGPSWVFTWNTLSPWSTSPRRPLQQTKHCLWFGDLDSYDRDAVLWGDPPDSKKHPTTRFEPESGRRLCDLWGESLRWLHEPGARAKTLGQRFERKGNHAKPIGWVKCLIGNTSTGLIVDPFMGTGCSMRAAKDLGRQAIGIEIDESTCEQAAESLSQGVLF